MDRGPDIFISYSRKDSHLAGMIAEMMGSLGYEVWWDPNLSIGDYEEQISEKLESAKCVIVLWTPNSITSRNVKDEANIAAESKKLIPVILGVPRPPVGFGMIQSIKCDSKDEFTVKARNDIIKIVETSIGKPTTNKSGSANMELDGLKALFLKFKTSYHFYLVPQIPANKINNARHQCNIPKDEELIALFDNTLSGSARNCIVFSSRKMYWHDSGDSFSIEYAEFPSREIAIKRNSLFFKEISFNGKIISLAGLGSSLKRFIELLNAIKSLYAKIGKRQLS